MTQGEPDVLDREARRMNRVRRRVYIAALLLVAGVLACAWLVREPMDTYRATSAPLFMLVVMGLVIALWLERIPLARLETLILLVASAMPLSRQVWLYFMADAGSEQWLRLVGNNYWATSGVIVLGFVLTDRRRGLLAGTTIVLLSALIAAFGVGAALSRGHMPLDAVPYVVGALLFLILFLAMMSGATIMRDQWHSALSRTAVYSRWALTDELTGLANRRAVDDLLVDECAAADETDGSFAVIMADLDWFKHINDSEGHAVGDNVLKAVAAKLEASVRESDVVIRWGGEEFLIVASRATQEGARELAERCRRAIESEPLAGAPMTMTFGVATYAQGDTPETLIARADGNLYVGKEAGRNRVQTDPVASMPDEGTVPERALG